MWFGVFVINVWIRGVKPCKTRLSLHRILNEWKTLKDTHRETQHVDCCRRNFLSTIFFRCESLPMKKRPNRSHWIIHCEKIQRSQRLSFICRWSSRSLWMPCINVWKPESVYRFNAQKRRKNVSWSCVLDEFLCAQGQTAVCGLCSYIWSVWLSCDVNVS